jgi:hypothetical protein
MEPLHFRPAPLPISDFPFPSPIRPPRVATRSLLKNVSASGERRDVTQHMFSSSPTMLTVG